MRHKTRGQLRAMLASPAIVSALSLGRMPQRDARLPIFDTVGMLDPEMVEWHNDRAATRDAFTNAMLYRMPGGIPGDINRGWAATVEPNLLDTNYSFLAYGLCSVMDQTDFLLRPAGGTTTTQKNDAAAVLYGLLARPFPLNQQTAVSFFGSNPLTTPAGGTPPASGLVDVLKRGYMTVLVAGTAPTGAGNPVWILANGASANMTTNPCGSVHGANDAGTVQAGVAGTTYFRGLDDTNGNGEIAWNL